jgi:hypothetical protein
MKAAKALGIEVPSPRVLGPLSVQIFETVRVRHRGTFRVGETFLMQLHRSRPEHVAAARS